MGVCANLKGANSEKCETPRIKGEPLGGKELKFTCTLQSNDIIPVNLAVQYIPTTGSSTACSLGARLE